MGTRSARSRATCKTTAPNLRKCSIRFPTPSRTRAQLEALLASYEALQSSLDEFAQQHGVEGAVNQAAQQTHESVGQEEEASDQAQQTVGQAAQGVQDTAGDAAGEAQDVAGGGEMTEKEHEAAEEAAGEVAGQEQGQEQQDAEEGVPEETGQAQGVVGRATQGVGKAVGKVGRTARRLVPGMHLLSEETDERGARLFSGRWTSRGT